MPDDQPAGGGSDDLAATTQWDPASVLRSRMEAAQRQRDTSIAELRSSMDDEEIVNDLGIDLGAFADHADNSLGEQATWADDADRLGPGEPEGEK